MQPPIVIVGGGLAGLACASILIQHNQPVQLFEASDRLGGRVRTDIVDGYRIDRGFQMVPEAHPALTEVVSLPELAPRRFDPGVLIWDGHARHVLENPFRNPKRLPSVVRSQALPRTDILRLAKLAWSSRMTDWPDVAAASVTRDGSCSARELLAKYGFSDLFLSRFARPFWGGISLDPTLSFSAGIVLFSSKMFSDGALVLPAGGMQGLPDAMAIRHPDGMTRLNTPVDRIVIDHEHAIGIEIDGEHVAASAIVVATDGPTANKLTGIETIPTEGIGCTTVYLAGAKEPSIGNTLLLNGSGYDGVNHIAPLSAVAPSYAPQGKHLIAAVVLDIPSFRGRRQETLQQLARADAARMLGHQIEDWEIIATAQTSFARFRQPAGYVAHLPRNRTATPGLYLAGEYTVDSSIGGAIRSGIDTAHALLRDRGILTA